MINLFKTKNSKLNSKSLPLHTTKLAQHLFNNKEQSLIYIYPLKHKAMKDSKNLISVFTGYRLKANVIMEILKDNNIPVVSHDRFNAGLQAGYVDGVAGDIELLIEKEDEEKALALIKEYEDSI